MMTESKRMFLEVKWQVVYQYRSVFEGIKYYLLTQIVQPNVKYQEHHFDCYSTLKMKTASFPNRCYICTNIKCSRYRPGVAQRASTSIALLFHDRGTRGGWVVSSTPRPQFTPGKHPVPILQEAGWAPGPLWTGGKFHPHRDSIPDRPARRQ